MILTPKLSRLVLISHITFSVGWLGAVVVFMVLAITETPELELTLVYSEHYL